MRAALIGILLMLAGVSSQAANDVVVRDGTVVRVSAAEPNLIEASTGRVLSFVFAEDAFDASSDVDSGVIYFRPLVSGPRSGFVEIETASGGRERISLVLVADSEAQAQRIVIRMEEEEFNEPADSDVPALPTDDLERNSAVKQLLRKLVLGSSDLLIAVDHSSARFGTLDQGVIVNLVGDVAAGAWQVLIVRVENTHERAVALNHADLARLHPGTVAVASETDEIMSGQAATAYLVRASHPIQATQ